MKPEGVHTFLEFARYIHESLKMNTICIDIYTIQGKHIKTAKKPNLFYISLMHKRFGLLVFFCYGIAIETGQ
jgi:hypothetical protein